MTCVVGVVEGGVIWMGADSAATDEDGGKCVPANPKIFAKRDAKDALWLIGYAGDYRFGQLVEHSLVLPGITNGHRGNMIRFLVTEFVTDLRSCLRGNGAMGEQREDRREKAPGELLIGISGELFVVDADFQVFEPNTQYTAIGSGSPPALGALGATKGLLGPEERLIIALEQAQEYSVNVSDPFLLINSKDAELDVRCVRSVRRKQKRRK